jgi:hypothetical protein
MADYSFSEARGLICKFWGPKCINLYTYMDCGLVSLFSRALLESSTAGF